MNRNTYFNFRFYNQSSACLAAASGGSKFGSPVTLGVTRRQSRVYFMDCKGILTPILRTWVQKKYPSFTKLRTCGGLKKGPFFREIRNTGAPRPPGRIATCMSVELQNWRNCQPLRDNETRIATCMSVELQK